ncbi:uncharacterized protein LOC124498013 [Dermatophagoides farinae]|uniref:uncharacterized protein LOC124498013 n=1 Tax=Dermatophagoides farinae TaxID=6954 RepID=UPI003F5F4382
MSKNQSSSGKSSLIGVLHGKSRTVLTPWCRYYYRIMLIIFTFILEIMIIVIFINSLIGLINTNVFGEEVFDIVEIIFCLIDLTYMCYGLYLLFKQDHHHQYIECYGLSIMALIFIRIIIWLVLKQPILVDIGIQIIYAGFTIIYGYYIRQ